MKETPRKVPNAPQASVDFVGDLASEIHRTYKQNDPTTAWDQSKAIIQAHMKRLTIETYLRCIHDMGISHRYVLNEMKKQARLDRD